MSLDIFLFGDSGFRRIEKSINLQGARAEVIASNLANVETPGYKARDLNFKEVLSQKAGAGPGLRIAATDTKHMGNDIDASKINISPTENRGSIRVDGNTVDLDREMSKLANTQLLYEASLMALSKKLGLINRASRNGY